MAAAARLLAERRMDVLDINFGCPAKKVVKKCGGSALLADLPLLEEIVRARDRRVHGSGDGQDPHRLGRGVGQLPGSGPAAAGPGRALGHHARPHPGPEVHAARPTGTASPSLVETLDIPVIGNGDVVDGETYRRMVEHTRCHAVMIGRGRHRQPLDLRPRCGPWTRADPRPEVSFTEMCEVTIDHLRGEVAMRGEEQGCLVVRKHIAKCFQGYPGAAGSAQEALRHPDSR